MHQTKRGRNRRTLYVLMVLAVLWSAALRLVYPPGSRMLLAGSLSVLFGLFVCSRAAANMIDMFLFESYFLRSKSTRRDDLLWIGLNLLILTLGWITIIEGTTRFVGRPG